MSSPTQQQIKNVFKRVCAKYGITQEEIKGRNRMAHLVDARREVAILLRQLNCSYPYIAKLLSPKGGPIKHHTTAMHYLGKH